MTTHAHRIEVTPASGQVVVTVNGTVVATSARALVLTETGCPPRYYLPAEDVRRERLRPEETTSHCPFKGDAVYWSVETGEGVAGNVVWSYPEPLPAVKEIAGLLAFWAEKPGVTVELDGHPA